MRADKIGKNMIFWRKIVIFHTKYPKNFRASLRSAQFFLSAPPLTRNPGSAPIQCLNNVLIIKTNVLFPQAEMTIADFGYHS